MGANGMTARHKAHGALAVASRVQLLDALRAGEGALDARELAAACGLHVSTVRFHLEVLGEAGLVRSHTEPATRRGRPRLLYTPASTGDTGTPDQTGGYQLLAGVLAAHWADTPAERSRRAESAGRAVATTKRLAPPPSTVLTLEESVAQVSGMFAELGFEPDVTRDGEDLQIRLHTCPFRAVAAEHPDVVCSLHLGLLRGALTELRAPATVSSLVPFVEPHLCVAHIAPADPVPDEPGTSAGDRR
ncbi:helix-turn-helix transcriptional regulator [Pseudonocardia bannensis]|uniref:Helix-turn-helix domain-containing protein n=1 Tax=Pseudonocardia bannensis TaxID=630973 RepID=A0A848DD93_9PSEU|nr:ArsR family transcriptional regulator [Pseudonocardia bannensis]NMH90553.1 helix-turn-helix domain-containing protein [Pseudonocardia bannensis]